MKVMIVDSLVENEYTYCLCEGLARLGMDISLVCTGDRVFPSRPSFRICRWLPSKKPAVSRVVKVFQYLDYLGKILLYAVRNSFDIIHFQFFRFEIPDSLFFASLKATGIRTFYTAHNLLPHEPGFADNILKTMVYRTADRIIVHSEHIKDKLANRFNVMTNKISVIPHGHFDLYLPEKLPTKKDTRAWFGLKASDNILLYFGRIREYKGLDLLLDAFDLVCRNNTRLYLLIAGCPANAELESHYRQRIDKIECSERIIFHPHFIPNDQVAKYFIASDLVALPYKHIDHSGVVHLAYSFGRPVVATSAGDFSHTIRSGKEGFLVPPGDPEAFADTVINAFSDKKKLVQMGRGAKRYSDREFSWDKIAQMTIDAYRKL